MSNAASTSNNSMSLSSSRTMCLFIVRLFLSVCPETRVLLHCSGIIYSGQFFLHSLPGLLCHPSSVFRHFLVLVKPFRISLFGKLSGESLGKGINGSLKVGHVVTEVFLVESFEILIFPRGKAGPLFPLLERLRLRGRDESEHLFLVCE